MGAGTWVPGLELTTRPAARRTLLAVDMLDFVTSLFCISGWDDGFSFGLLIRSLTSIDFSGIEPSLHSRAKQQDASPAARLGFLRLPWGRCEGSVQLSGAALSGVGPRVCCPHKVTWEVFPLVLFSGEDCVEFSWFLLEMMGQFPSETV